MYVKQSITLSFFIIIITRTTVMNYYEILECNKQASLKEIKKSYQKLILKYHPDKQDHSSLINDKFSKIDEAYKTLRDPEKRKIYDAELCQQSIDDHSNVFAEVTPKEFQKNSADPSVYYLCRCGGSYKLDSYETLEDELKIECDECSLVIIVKDKP